MREEWRCVWLAGRDEGGVVAGRMRGGMQGWVDAGVGWMGAGWKVAGRDERGVEVGRDEKGVCQFQETYMWCTFS
jgi:hypothetical protein